MVGDTGGGSGEIFIVDDDPAICTVLSVLFSREGYQPTCFSDGASLLAATRKRTPACILLDVHIPGRSGLDVLKNSMRRTILRRSSSCRVRATFQWRSLPSGMARSILSRSPFVAARLSRVCARGSKLRPAVLRMMKPAPTGLGLRSLPAGSPSRRVRTRCWRNSWRGRPIRKRAASWESARARSRFIVPGSWKSSAPRTSRTSSAS